MNKQDLKSLLENIYHLLAEDAPPPTAEEPRGTVRPGYAPGMSPQERTSWYDPYQQPPTLPPVGPFDGGWCFEAEQCLRVAWPPPSGAVPPAGSGGMWIAYDLDPRLGQIIYYYVYPENQNGFFPVWMWQNFNNTFLDMGYWGGPS